MWVPGNTLNARRFGNISHEAIRTPAIWKQMEGLTKLAKALIDGNGGRLDQGRRSSNNNNNKGAPANYTLRHFLMPSGFLSSFIKALRNEASFPGSELVRCREKTVTWIQVLKHLSLFNE